MPADESLALSGLITSTLAVLTQYLAALSPVNVHDPTTTASPEHIVNPPNPLHVLRDSAALLKAHTTKLSLLAINKPFTPSAISKVLRELSSTCLPAMMSAVQICTSEDGAKTWGKMMGEEVRARVRRVVKEVEMLLSELQTIAESGGNASGSSSGRRNGAKNRDSLSSTGVVWESCDALIELEKLGVAGLSVQKAEQYRDTIKDAIEELREWREGSDTETEGREDPLLDPEDEGVAGDEDSLDDIFNAANSMPKDRPELKLLAEEAENKLKKVVLLYTAVIKRRLKTYKPGPDLAHSNVFDQVVATLKHIPPDIDDLVANCFYDLDESAAQQKLTEIVDKALGLSKVVQRGWKGEEDEYTSWAKKWEEAIGTVREIEDQRPLA